MGKRSNFERRAKDFYETPVDAIKPLIMHLPAQFTYIEPCYGNGAILKGLELLLGHNKCVYTSDLYPAKNGIAKRDATTLDMNDVRADMFITNPPWSRDKKSDHLLHNIIDNLAGQKPTWLLFDADWMHTKQAWPYLEYCVKIVSVGRVSWMENGTSGKDNCAWYLFDKKDDGPTEFIGRK
jgi:hypothetical protein